MNDQLTGTEQRPTTTQLTSKRIKLTSLVGWVAFVVGLGMIFAPGGEPTIIWGALVAGSGFVTAVFGKLMNWWKHEWGIRQPSSDPWP